MNQREASKQEWTTGEGVPELTRINSGSLQRIADGVEKMAANWSAMSSERERYERWYREELKRREHAERRITSLRGVITRLKRAPKEGRKG